VLLAGDKISVAAGSREHAPWALTQSRFRRGDSTSLRISSSRIRLKNSLLRLVGPEFHAEISRRLRRIPTDVKIDLVKQTADYAFRPHGEFAVIASPTLVGGRCGDGWASFES